MRCVTACLGVLLVTVWLGPAAWAQPATGPRAADATSPDAIIAALYDVISGPAGQARDWDRFRGLFAPGARLIPAAPRQDGSIPVALSPDDYIKRANDALLKGFFEREVSSSNFPRFDRNMNTGGNNYDETTGVVAHNKVHHSKQYPSSITVTVVKR